MEPIVALANYDGLASKELKQLERIVHEKRDEIPWFKRATVEQIHHVEQQGRQHLHWPDLDVDLDVDRIREPEKFPLVSRF